MTEPIVIPVTKKDSAYKEKVEQERQGQAAQEEVKLPDLVELLHKAASDKPMPVPPHAKVMVVVWDPFSRNMATFKVQNINGLTDMLQVLEEGSHALRDREQLGEIMSRVAMLVTNGNADLYAQLKTGGRP